MEIQKAIAIDEIKGEIFRAERNLYNINRTLSIAPDISPETVEKFYGQAFSIFADKVKKRLEDVHCFNTALLADRQIRMLAEKEDTEKELEILREKLAEVENLEK